MAKKRKTLEQKKKADSQHSAYPTQQTVSNYPTYSLHDISSFNNPFTKKETILPAKKSNTTVAIVYQYVLADLRKTGLTTLAIVVAQFVLLYIVNR